LERGCVLKEGWPKYYVGLKDGTLVVRYHSTDPDSIAREKQRLREMGLVEGVHSTVKMQEGGEKGYVSILKRGLGARRPAFRPRLWRTAETGG
jgi:Fe2+ transport system protein FeoA